MRGKKRPFLALTATLMGGALLGKILGFVRELEMARLLGVTYVADTFRGALTAALLPIAPMQGDLVFSVMIPLRRQWQLDGKAQAYFPALTACFCIVSILFAVLVWVFAAAWLDILVGGFGPEAHALAVRFVRVMALGMPASTVCACLSCIEISVGRSRITAARASAQNIGIILGIFIMASTGEAIAIAWGFTAAFNVVAVYGGIKLWLENEFYFKGVTIFNMQRAISDFFRRARPLLFEPFANQGNVLLEKYIGSIAGVGVIAALDYARTLSDMALYIISQPLGYVILSQAEDKGNVLKEKIKILARIILGFGIPAATLIALFAPDIVQIVFQRGSFQEHAVNLTAGALRGISVGLWASTLGWILVRLLQAGSRYPLAARVIAFAYCAQAGANLLLSYLGGLGAMGLGFGEAARGIAMLGGAALALRCGKIVLEEMLRSVPATLLLIGSNSYFLYNINDAFIRVSLAALVYVIVVMPSVAPFLRRTYRSKRVADERD